MGLLGRLFEKERCAVCEAEAGVLSRRRIEDGYLCSACARKLSPYFEGRRHATSAQIKEQLAYREENKKAVAEFNATRTIEVATLGKAVASGRGATSGGAVASGGAATSGSVKGTRVILDEDAGTFIVTDNPEWYDANPDVFDLGQVTGCDYEVDENRTEVLRKNGRGKEVSYNPPRFDSTYDFHVTIHLEHPYVTTIRFKANQEPIEHRDSAEFQRVEEACRQIREALTQTGEGPRVEEVPKAPVQCPHCMATTMLDAHGCCEYCGSQLS